MDVTKLMEGILTVIIALITTFLIPWIKTKVDKERLDKIMKYVKIAVEAAEQIWVESGAGSEKKQYVIDFLREKGFIFDEETINNMIEAAVLEMNTQLSE